MATAIRYPRIDDVLVRKIYPLERNKSVFIEHHPLAMVDAATVSNSSRGRFANVHHAGGANDILPTMSSLMSILEKEDNGDRRRFAILFSDGDIGSSSLTEELAKGSGNDDPHVSVRYWNALQELPNYRRSQFQLMLDQWEMNGIPVGVVDYGDELSSGVINQEQIATGADVGNMTTMMENMIR